VKPSAKYPPTLITTADQHDRVFPGHSFKFAAALQAAQAGLAPILIGTQTRARRGAGKPTAKLSRTRLVSGGFSTPEWHFTETPYNC
jgi:prolyl oligopeptidase